MSRASDIFEVAPYPICFYEGDGMGEGIVKEIRPILLSGLRKGWTIAGQETYYRTKTLAYMQDMLLTQTAMNIVTAKKKPVRPNTKVYRLAAELEYALKMNNAFSFSLFRNLVTQENVLAVVISFEKQKYIRVLHVDNEASFQDPHGFAYFATSMMPILEHTIIDEQFFSSHTLIYVASGVALPSLQHNVYAFVLGDGGKKFQDML